MKYWSNRGAKTVAAVTVATPTFTEAEISQDAAMWYGIETTGANNHLTSAVTNVRVKSSALGTLWDCTAAQLRALIEALAPAHTIPPAARLRFTIPVGFPGVDVNGWTGFCGVPAGVGASVEVAVDANSSAGTIQIAGEAMAPRMQPAFYSRFVALTTGIGATSTPGRLNLNYPGGLLAGIALPIVGATGILACRVVVGGRLIAELTQAGLLESQFITNPQSLTTTFFWKAPALFEVTAGDSYLEIETGAGSAATDPINPLVLYPNPLAKAA